MKKTLLLSFFIMSLLTVNSLYAQKNNHLTFKEIPITGKLADFVKKMEDSGFTVVQKDGTMTEMKGQFVNQDCEIYIASSSKSNIVWKVTVFLPKDNSWRSIKGDYFKYKNLFTQKYGSWSLRDYEFFTKPYYEGDGYEIQALTHEKCDYISFWTLKNGNIAVKISKYAQIQFIYEDDINANIAQKEQEEKVLNDI